MDSANFEFRAYGICFTGIMQAELFLAIEKKAIANGWYGGNKVKVGLVLAYCDLLSFRLAPNNVVSSDGKVSQLEHVFIRGSKVRFMIIPDMLKNAPMFKRLDARIKGKGSAIGVGRGRAVAMRARAQAAGRGGPGRGAVPPVRR
ncbi:small nuclear ribonucleoprotein SmD3b-like [Ananas comosus]|uniref:Small nuclear ribonucleoprotein SmD3b-like n=1 Tax=Ananas comosus TaxID=4615 RepID=A0A6P5H1A9_ANACO|nr:small nuclear ribonucleoprotein SmD3b-like [Ananas comosus]